MSKYVNDLYIIKWKLSKKSNNEINFTRFPIEEGINPLNLLLLRNLL